MAVHLINDTSTIRRVRVAIAWLLLSVALAGQAPSRSKLTRSEELAVTGILEDGVRRRRAADRGVLWEGHFLQAAEGRTYVPYTLRVEDAGDRFRSAAVALRVVGWNYSFNDRFAVNMEADGNDRVFRGSLMLRPGRTTVYAAILDRDARSSRPLLLEHITVVPGYGKSLQISSVIVVDHMDSFEPGSAESARAERPYTLGSVVLVPAHGTAFPRRGVLTVAFQIYNLAAFEDGKPDVEVEYRVFRKDQDRRPLGATAPQLFNQETLPEEFSFKAGHQLTPVQSLPLTQFEPGDYRLQIEATDHLVNKRTQANVPFTILP
jgi:hypothetical protein